MASAAQIEAFAWWLGQSPENRRSRHLRAQFGIAENTASKWLAQFNAELARVAKEATAIHLREFRDEYESIQLRAMTALPVAMDAIEHNLSVIDGSKQKGEIVDPDLIGKTLNGLKAVYSLAEAASGADIAKRRALQPGSDGGAGGAPRLPDLSGLFSVALPAAGEVVDPPETVLNNDSGNENRSDSDETLVE